MIRDVLTYPDRRLKQVAVPVRTFGSELARLADDLRDTAASFPRTVGIAAPQIGALWRVVYVDSGQSPKVEFPRPAMVLVNPRVTASEGSDVAREGCLSLPELTADVRRAYAITVEAQSPDGRQVRFDTEGFEARIIQHEIDHLDGVLILDRIASLARDVFPRRRGRGRRSPGRDLVERARLLATLAHVGQHYDGGPYTDHLQEVVGVLGRHQIDDPLLIAAAWLHDVVEDTPVTVDALRTEFGTEVAAIVEALTVPAWPDHAAAHEDSWRRIAVTPGAVAVKLADRVANVARGGRRAQKYLDQQERFEALLADADPGALGGVVPAMWTQLRSELAALRTRATGAVDPEPPSGEAPLRGG
ncbi:MAG: peptide deformylase [Thermoleophilia bacterium]